jgi:hypothetical protein
MHESSSIDLAVFVVFIEAILYIKQSQISISTMYYTYIYYIHMYAPDDGCVTETCCGNNIGRGEEELLR